MRAPILKEKTGKRISKYGEIFRSWNRNIEDVYIQRFCNYSSKVSPENESLQREAKFIIDIVRNSIEIK